MLRFQKKKIMFLQSFPILCLLPQVNYRKLHFAVENNCILNATKCIHFNPFNGFFCRRLIEQITSVFIFFLFRKINEKMFSLILKTFIQSIYSSSHLIKYFYTEIGNSLNVWRVQRHVIINLISKMITLTLIKRPVKLIIFWKSHILPMLILFT